MTASLRDRLARPPILVAPGVYDALTASLATEAGAEALYLSGAALAYFGVRLLITAVRRLGGWALPALRAVA